MEYYQIIIFALLAGITQSIFYSFFVFIKDNKEIIQKIIGVGLIGIMFSEAKLAEYYFPKIFEKDNAFFLFVVIFFLTTILSVILFITKLYKNHSKSTPSQRVSIHQFLSHPSKIADGSFFDKERNKNQQEYLEKLTAILNEIKEVATNNKIPTITIPENHPILINDTYLINIKNNFLNISGYFCYINQMTDDFLYKSELANKNKETIDNEDFFKKYLYYLSSATAEYLFDYTKYDVRIHFRILHKDTDTYEKFYLFGKDHKESNNPLKSMSANTGIISKAIELKVSLIKSANSSLHEQGNNDHLWKDYITMVFDDIKKDDEPFLSMTISVHNDDLYKDLLYLLSYIEFEREIGKNILKVYERYPILPK